MAIAVRYSVAVRVSLRASAAHGRAAAARRIDEISNREHDQQIGEHCRRFEIALCQHHFAAQPAAASDHLGGECADERIGNTDPHAAHQRWQRGRQDHAPQQSKGAGAHGARRPELVCRHRCCSRMGGDDEGKHASEGDQCDFRQMVDAEPQDEDRQECYFGRWEAECD
jgi:hypothetical protein